MCVCSSPVDPPNPLRAQHASENVGEGDYVSTAAESCVYSGGIMPQDVACATDYCKLSLGSSNDTIPIWNCYEGCIFHETHTEPDANCGSATMQLYTYPRDPSWGPSTTACLLPEAPSPMWSYAKFSLDAIAARPSPPPYGVGSFFRSADYQVVASVIELVNVAYLTADGPPALPSAPMEDPSSVIGSCTTAGGAVSCRSWCLSNPDCSMLSVLRLFWYADDALFQSQLDAHVAIEQAVGAEGQSIGGWFVNDTMDTGPEANIGLHSIGSLVFRGNTNESTACFNLDQAALADTWSTCYPFTLEATAMQTVIVQTAPPACNGRGEVVGGSCVCNVHSGRFYDPAVACAECLPNYGPLVADSTAAPGVEDCTWFCDPYGSDVGDFSVAAASSKYCKPKGSAVGTAGCSPGFNASDAHCATCETDKYGPGCNETRLACAKDSQHNVNEATRAQSCICADADHALPPLCKECVAGYFTKASDTLYCQNEFINCFNGNATYDPDLDDQVCECDEGYVKNAVRAPPSEAALLTAAPCRTASV